MANTVRIKRRLAGGAAGAPSALKNAELAFNEQDNVLYYGKGDSGGNATAIIGIGGHGAFLPLSGGTLTGALTIDQSAQAAITLKTGTSGVAQVILSEGATQRGLFDYVTTGFGGGSANTVRLGSLTSSPVVFLTNAAERVRIDTSGHVGIGTTANIAGFGASAKVLSVLAADRAVSELATSAADATGLVCGQLAFVQQTLTGGTQPADKQVAAILGMTEGGTAGNRGGQLRFYTKPNAGSIGTERMIITNTGQVGIGGTPGTAFQLDVTGTIRATQPHNTFGGAGGSSSAPTTTNTNILLYEGSTTNWAGIGADSSGNMYFVTGIGSPATRMVIGANAITTFWNNVVIGAPTGSASLTLSATASTDPAVDFRINNTRQFLVFAQASDAAFYVLDTDFTHGVKLPQNTSSWASFSDRRLADKQGALTVTGLLDNLHKFRLIGYGDTLGVVAQELHQYLPQLVIPGADDDDRIIHKANDPGAWAVKPSDAAWVAIQLCKELLARIEALESL